MQSNRPKRLETTQTVNYRCKPTLHFSSYVFVSIFAIIPRDWKNKGANNYVRNYWGEDRGNDLLCISS